MARQDSSAQREEAYEGNGVRRNPYLVDYEAQRRRRMSPGGRPVSQRRQMSSGYSASSGRGESSRRTVRQTESEVAFAPGRSGRDSVSRLELYRDPVQEDYEEGYPDTVDEFSVGQRNGKPARRQGGTYREAPEAEYSRDSRRGTVMDGAESYPEAAAAGYARSRHEEPESRQSRSRNEEPESQSGNRRRELDSSWIGNRREEPGSHRSQPGNRRRELDSSWIESRQEEPESRQSQSGSRRRELDSSWLGNRREEPGTRRVRSRQASQGVAREQEHRSAPQAGRTSSRRASETARPVSYDLAPQARPAAGRASASQRRAAIQRRKKQILMQRLFVGAWILCILLFAVVFAVKSSRAAGNQNEDSLPVSGELDENLTPQASGRTVQGISAEKYEEHPEWTEDFLTPNEYSRPGNALEEVNNIFVHYTANPGTSAAQNRSYFEWQKDTHEASVSAHFVIGYEGEIIQCVPLDEIAYAVMTRNYDSISIECCYLEKDGSFTQATYNSLISLLSWLIDVYDLDSEDILRHYDCGGKKCPLYYTEHPGAWEQLKKDVDNFSNL